MNNEQYLLLKLDEECKEVGIIANKSIQFGLDSDDNGNIPFTNKQRLFAELNDVLASIEMLNEECNLGFVPDRNAIENKKTKVKKYRNVSKELGNVK